LNSSGMSLTWKRGFAQRKESLNILAGTILPYHHTHTRTWIKMMLLTSPNSWLMPQRTQIFSGFLDHM
jgi:hypothetical protein